MERSEDRRWEARIEPCPSCGTEMVNDPRYAFWCEACNWNLIRPSDRAPRRGLAAVLARLDQRQGRRLVEEVIRHGAQRPRFDLQVAVAYLVAVLVFAVVIAIARVGVAMVVGGGGPFAVFFGVTLVALAIAMRPRIPSIHGERLHRDDVPRLFGLLDRISAAMNAPTVDEVVVSGSVNAWFGRSGLRRRRVLEIGMPMFIALEPQQRVALLGHEIGHSINNDASRTFVVASAVGALAELWAMLEPDSILPAAGDSRPVVGLLDYLVAPFRIVQRGVALVVLGLAALELRLCFRTMQAAEYYADGIAARVAGTEATRSLLARLHAATAATALAWSSTPADPVGATANRLREIPIREIERIRRIEASGGFRADDTHPPTGQRERVAASLPAQAARIVLTNGESEAIDRELERFRASLGRQMRDEALAALS